jgi:creatinine amidohydrolase/Fe(II)-dependent formamide hydrolase-like protein
MHWKEMTSDQFARQAELAQGVCLVPLSCIERHAHHLPLGVDLIK